MYRKDEAGDKARKKVMDSKLVQAQIGPGIGLYTGVRGTAELVSALSDLYLDTETMDNVQKALPEIILMIFMVKMQVVLQNLHHY